MNLQSEIVRPPMSSPSRNDDDLQVGVLDGALETAWQDFVAKSTDCSPFHEIGWMRAVERVYGHRPQYLVARRGERGAVLGVLPLFEVKGPFTGRALISVPYAVYGGASAVSDDVHERLYDSARELADNLSVRFAEFRTADPVEGLVARHDYFTFRKRMPNDAKDVLGSYPKKARAAIRHAQTKYCLQSRFGHELLDEFYQVYALSLRRLASPPHARRFFESLLQEFDDRAIVQIVYHEQQAVAGVFSFQFQNQILPYWAGIDTRFNHMNPSNFAYYSLMEHAVGLGLEIFDFGRTRADNEGGCNFKRNQGFDPYPLNYCTYSPRGERPPDLRPSNRKFSAAQEVWKRLPLPIVTRVARTVTRWLP
jgi:FemAB-related protein (PEP-CTERM system-associated)